MNIYTIVDLVVSIKKPDPTLAPRLGSCNCNSTICSWRRQGVPWPRDSTLTVFVELLGGYWGGIVRGGAACIIFILVVHPGVAPP